jgi:hypothetical protein
MMIALRIAVAAVAVVCGLLAWVMWSTTFEKAPDDPDRKHVPVHSRDVAFSALISAVAIAAAFAVLLI